MVYVERRGQMNHFNEIIILLIVRIMHGRKQFCYNNLDKLIIMSFKRSFLLMHFSLWLF